MRRSDWMKTLAAGLMSVSLAAELLAQESQPQDPQPGRRAQGRRAAEGRPAEGRPGARGANPEMAARGMAMMLRNLPVFRTLDVDEDGQLSASEIENASKSLLKLDKNGDGILSAEELRPDPAQMPMFAGPNGPGRPGPAGPGPGPGPEMMMRMFENRDQDKDGKLSGDEIPPPMKERLSNMDTNGDGSIDKSEIEQAIRRLEGLRPGNRRPDERSEGGQGVRPRRPSSDT